MKLVKSKKLNRRQKGFTLIELLVVVGILGVLAAIVVPNVSRFVGSGKSESAKTELQNVQTAVTAMMTDKGLTSVTAVTTATNAMSAFPDATNALYGGSYNYIQKATTANYYKVATDGTVTGYTDSAGTNQIQ